MEWGKQLVDYLRSRESIHVLEEAGHSEDATWRIIRSILDNESLNDREKLDQIRLVLKK